MMMFLNTDGRQNGRSFNLDFKFTDEQIKLLQKYGNQIYAIYYSEKNNKGQLRIQAIEPPI
jgi:hypothetical protein